MTEDTEKKVDFRTLEQYPKLLAEANTEREVPALHALRTGMPYEGYQGHL